MPTHNQEAWKVKFARNRARDEAAEAALGALGLRVMIVWECQTKDRSGLRTVLDSYLR